MVPSSEPSQWGSPSAGCAEGAQGTGGPAVDRPVHRGRHRQAAKGTRGPRGTGAVFKTLNPINLCKPYRWVSPIQTIGAVSARPPAVSLLATSSQSTVRAIHQHGCCVLASRGWGSWLTGFRIYGLPHAESETLNHRSTKRYAPCLQGQRTIGNEASKARKQDAIQNDVAALELALESAKAELRKIATRNREVSCHRV